jgi:hypothetical protein
MVFRIGRALSADLAGSLFPKVSRPRKSCIPLPNLRRCDPAKHVEPGPRPLTKLLTSGDFSFNSTEDDVIEQLKGRDDEI